MTEFSKAVDRAKERGDLGLARRIRVEGQIARFTVKRLLAAGFEVSVYDGEEITVKRSAKLNEIVGAMFTTDEDRLLVYKPGAADRFGWIYFVYGNDGPDVINDYTTNLEPQMEAVSTYADKVAVG